MMIVLPAKERRPLRSDNAVFEGLGSAPRPVQRQPDRDRLARLADCGNEQTRVQEQRLRATVSNDRTIEVFHSSRIRIDGSIASARRAGIHVARRPSDDIASTAPANTSGSRGVA